MNRLPGIVVRELVTAVSISCYYIPPTQTDSVVTISCSGLPMVLAGITGVAGGPRWRVV